MEENVRIVVTGDNRDALKKLNKVEDAVNRLNSATKKVEVKVNGIQEAERQAARLYQALERVENAALSKLPRSVQLVIAYLKAATQAAQELGGRLAFAGTVVDDLQRAKFIPAGLLAAGREVKTLNRDLLITLDMFQRISAEFSNLRSKALPRAGGSQGFTGFLTQQYPAMPPGFGAGPPRLPPSYGPGFGPENDKAPVKTIERLEAQRRALESLYRTIEIGTPRYEQLGEDIAQLTQELQDAQLRFQKVTTKATPGSTAALREEIAAKEAALNQTKRGTRDFNELADELRGLNTELSKTERFIEGRTKGRAGRVGTALQSAALGGGFPLLFGGPSFSALGGAAGGFAGGLAGQGTGFALGIVGSAIGSAFDALAQKGLELADALNKPVQSIDTLLDALPRLDTETKNFINELRAAGLEASAAAVVVEEFNNRLNAIGITDVEKFKNDTKEFKAAVKELEVAASALAASKFINIINLLKDGFVILSQLEPQGPLQRAAQAAQLQGELTDTKGQAKATTTGTEPSQTQLDIQKQFNQLELDSVKIQRDREALIQNSINLSADQLAVRRSEINLAEAVNKTERVRLEYLKSLGTEKEAGAFNALKEARTAERVARIERNRLKVLRDIADVQAGQNLRKLEIAENKNLSQAQIREAEVRKGRLAGLTLERQLIQQSVNERIELINIERDQFLLANKGRGLDESINALYNRRITIARGLAEIDDEEINKKIELLQLQREIDSTLLTNAQNRQLSESGTSLARAQLELANPFGGDAYEQELQRLNQVQELENIRIQGEEQILALQNKKAAASAEDQANIQAQIDKQQQVNDAVIREAEARQAVERQILRQQQALEKVQPVVSALQTGFTELFTSVIDGSKSTQEVLSDMFGNIAKAFASMAAEIIAKQLVMIALQGILKALGAVSAASTPDPFSDNVASVLPDTSNLADVAASTPLNIPGRADGGPVANNVPYLVGEEGPELFVPFQNGTIVPNGQTQQMMSGASQGGGNSSTVNNSFQQMQVTNVPFTRSAEQASVIAAEQETAKAIRNPGPIDVRYESQVINGVEYVTAEQHQKGMAQAADRGRALTLASLQNSVKARRRIGL